MFEKKRCRNCGKKVKDEWEFCPSCGEEVIKLKREVAGSFEEGFGEMDRKLEKIEKIFSFGPFRVPGLKLRSDRKSGNIVISIQDENGEEQRIEFRSPGEVRKTEPEMKRRAKRTEEKTRSKRLWKKAPKSTEEPEAEIKNVDGKKMITIKLPGVKSEDNIEVKKLEQSVEVKALAGDKAYFKLIPVPANATINKRFEKGILNLEIEK